ncbi:MAG TPA: peptide MFS transporter [Rhizomicrobium sp.]|jgi:POT family proton-dependent oligopeptide transporter|nr:peptide MFS transporter [Rhizomicrobium sp.]
MAMTDTAPDQSPEKNWFGHPRGLTFLFGTEMWERFSYYGNRVLLPIYLTGYLLLPGHSEHVVGYETLKHFFESFRGPLGIQPLQSMIYATYTALVYFTPLIGGFLADRFFGRRSTVIVGGLFMAAGQFLMTSDNLFFVAMMFMIVGNGAFKPNISTQVGGLYKPGDHRIDRAYSIFYVGINVGSLLGQIICGFLGEKVAWHYGFAAAGVGMLIGTVVYMFALRTLPRDTAGRQAKAATVAAPPRKPFMRDDWIAVAILILLFIPSILFWATYEQSGNVIEIWSRDYLDRTVNLGFASFEIPVTMLQNVNPFFIFTFTPLILMFWKRQQDRKREPSVVTKLALGCLLIAISYFLLAGVQHMAGAGKISWAWCVLYFAILTLGELYFSPVGLSLYAKAAPPQIAGFMMAVFLASSSPGNFLAGLLGSYWSGMDKTEFFLMIGSIIGIAAPIIFMFKSPIENILHKRREQEKLTGSDPMEQPHMEPPPG